MVANVLVVEDDRFNRNLICKVLRDEGHQIVEASDGAEGLELLYAQRFDLVITDFVMPRLNGLKFVEQLHPLQPQLPIIFITGYLSAISGKAILDNVAEVIPKPFEPGVLRSTVQRSARINITLMSPSFGRQKPPVRKTILPPLLHDT